MTQVFNPQSLYDRDFLLWTEDTVVKLEANDFARLDLVNLIEEINALGKSQRHAMRSLLRRLIEHLLKRRFVPLADCYLGWQKEIRAFRNDLKDILDDSPSLKNFFVEVLSKVSASAIASVKEEYPKVNFSEQWLAELDLESILEGNIWDEE